MRLLVDTHAFFWWLKGDARLSTAALDELERSDNDVLVSPVIAWEIATRSGLGKWPDGQSVLNLEELVATHDLSPLPITIAQARLAGLLPGIHRDPFDRMLAAQARLEGVPLVTADRALGDLGIEVLW
jgi:PIN domain nuclease of toxin-antitoxin system